MHPREPCPPKAQDDPHPFKTSVVFRLAGGTKHLPSVLAALAARSLEVTKVEARPARYAPAAAEVSLAVDCRRR